MWSLRPRQDLRGGADSGLLLLLGVGEQQELPLGVFVITDSLREARVHAGGCRWLSEESIATKVIDNGAKNGSYVFLRLRGRAGRSALSGLYLTARTGERPPRGGRSPLLV